MKLKLLLGASLLCFVSALAPTLPAQLKLPTPGLPVEPKAEPPKDTLGRVSPRATVLGFLSAIHKGNAEIAALYLNTPLRGEPAQNLARQLAEVLDRRLPARLNQLSELPEGSVPDPLRPDQDLVGTISTSKGDLDITLERLDRGKNVGKVWLFSKETLTAIPDVYQELTTPAVEKFLPEFLVKTRLAEIPLFEWLAVFFGLPALYLLTGLLNRVISWGAGALRHRVWHRPDAKDLQILSQPVRLLIMAVIIRWLISSVGLSLLARQFWATASLIIAIVGCVWLLLNLNGFVEQFFVRRSRRSGSASVLRLIRRLIDVLVLFASLLLTLYHFGVNITAALAGLGVGGIAVALAAQKTLENVIGGVSLIADQAVRVGDFLKIGDALGTVEDVGLRSTRIRTLDRTLVSVPNGQIANMSVETFSVRDKFWFHHVVGLLYETTPEQMRSIIEGVRGMLARHSNVEADSVRVRFLRLGAFSLDVDIFAYLKARDWNQFLEVQENLLLEIMDIVYSAGSGVAFPRQTMHLTSNSSSFVIGGNSQSAPEKVPARKAKRAESA